MAIFDFYEVWVFISKIELFLFVKNKLITYLSFSTSPSKKFPKCAWSIYNLLFHFFLFLNILANIELVNYNLQMYGVTFNRCLLIRSDSKNILSNEACIQRSIGFYKVWAKHQGRQWFGRMARTGCDDWLCSWHYCWDRNRQRHSRGMRQHIAYILLFLLNVCVYMIPVFKSIYLEQPCHILQTSHRQAPLWGWHGDDVAVVTPHHVCICFPLQRNIFSQNKSYHLLLQKIPSLLECTTSHYKRYNFTFLKKRIYFKKKQNPDMALTKVVDLRVPHHLPCQPSLLVSLSIPKE